MQAHLIIMFRNLVKSSLDQYLLPGTLTGTEILLVYAGQWKRILVTAVLATILLSRHVSSASPELENSEPKSDSGSQPDPAQKV